MKYSGQKSVNNWIKDNLFLIHEYAVSKSEEARVKLTESIKLVLKGKKKKIKMEYTTKLGDWIRIDFNPSKSSYWASSVTILIDVKSKIHVKNK